MWLHARGNTKGGFRKMLVGQLLGGWGLDACGNGYAVSIGTSNKRRKKRRREQHPDSPHI
jgi:hypothetical protein